jgi:hypothetical protein
MLIFEWILLLLFAAVVLTNLAQRLAVPATDSSYTYRCAVAPYHQDHCGPHR